MEQPLPTDCNAANPSQGRSLGMPEAIPLLLLRLGVRWFAVEVEAVVEVALRSAVTRVPTAPPHILGIAALRGRLVTVVSLEQMTGSTGMLSSENSATLPRLVVVRDGEYELAIVAEAIHGMINYEKLLGSDTTRPANLPTFVREEFEWQENRVCFLDISRLVATTARLAGIATNPDQGDL